MRDVQQRHTFDAHPGCKSYVLPVGGESPRQYRFGLPGLSEDFSSLQINSHLALSMVVEALLELTSARSRENANSRNCCLRRFGLARRTTSPITNNFGAA